MYSVFLAECVLNGYHAKEHNCSLAIYPFPDVLCPVFADDYAKNHVSITRVFMSLNFENNNICESEFLFVTLSGYTRALLLQIYTA